MPRTLTSYVLSTPTPHTQLNTGGGNAVQTLALDPRCAALLLSARTANVFLTFDNSTPAATNGLEIVSGAQPVLIPVGYYAHVNHTIKIIGAGINAVLNVVQMA